MLFDLPKEAEIYRTQKGVQVCADSIEILPLMPDETVDLIITNPPFALLRQKEYGNENQDEYVCWLRNFGREAIRVLKPTGSFVLDIGGAYQRGASRYARSTTLGYYLISGSRT